MGWSCSAVAHDVVLGWTAACVRQTGSQNIFRAGDTYYMYELSNREHPDGAITGIVLAFEGDPTQQDTCRAFPVGRFKVEGNGTVSRAPRVLRSLQSGTR